MKIITSTKNFFGKLPITIHPAFLLVAIYCAIFANIFSLMLLTSLALLHEMGHALVAARYGYKLNQIRLLPFGAELCGQDLFLSSHEIKIALAGPFVNFSICVICVAAMWVVPSIYQILNPIFSASLSLALFNLLPFFPLDGGRIFVALASNYTQRKNAVKIASVITMFFAIVLLTMFIISVFTVFNISFGIMGVSLIYSSILPSKNAKYERFTSASYKSKKLKSGLLQKTIAIAESATLLTAFCNTDARTQTVFSVQNKNGQQILLLSETDIENAINSGAAYKKIGEYFSKNN